MKPYRILVTGSREGVPRDIVERVLHRLCAEVPQEQPVIIVHGNAQGVDFYAKMWARKAHGISEEAHQAKWRKAGGALDRGAGHRRNALMVSLGAEVCIAFIAPCLDAKCKGRPPHGTHGASNCAKLAKKAGIKTLAWRP